MELWVGRQDVSKARQSPWPLPRGGQADVFQPIPFGTDVRGRTVKVPAHLPQLAAGQHPAAGEDGRRPCAGLRIALDPIAETWGHELKGSGDLDPLERVSHRFVSGVDDKSIAYAAESLRLLRAEIMRRTERLKALLLLLRANQPAHAAAGTRPTGTPAAGSAHQVTPARAPARPQLAALARLPGDDDAPRAPLVAVLASQRITPPTRTF